MIVEKSFIDAINYAKKSGVMIRPEYWSLWIRYVKSKGGFSGVIRMVESPKTVASIKA